MLHDLVSFGTRNIMAQFPFRLSLFLSLLLSCSPEPSVSVSFCLWLAGWRAVGHTGAFHASTCG